MNQTKSDFMAFKLTSFIIMALFVSCTFIYQRNLQNTITFQNQSGEPALVKIIGPGSKTIDIRDQSSRTVKVEAGKYYILVRYGNKPDEYSYARGDTLVVSDTTKQPATMNITLHKALGGGYPTHPILPEEFEKAQVIPTAKTIFREKTFCTAIGWYDYYKWRKSILTWIIDDSLKHTADEVTTAKSGTKFFTLHFSIPIDEFALENYIFILSDYKIQDKNNNWYYPIGGSLDGGRTYFKGEIKPGTKFTITAYSLRSKPGKNFFLNSLFFEIPECADGLIFYYQKQSLLISQVLLKVSPEIMQVVNSWNDEFVFLVRQDESIRNFKEIKKKDVHIWWTGEDDAKKLNGFLNAIGKKKMTLYGNNVWENWSDALQNKNIIIFIDAETSGRLMDDYAVKQVRFYCSTFP